MKSTVSFLILAVLLAACGPGGGTASGISKGELSIGIDESYKLMMSSEIQVYENFYPKAHVFPIYSTEQEIFKMLLADSIQAAVVNRPLNEEELAYFKSKGRYPESVKICTDAIALIINRSNTDSVMSLAIAEQVLGGKITNWNQVDAKSKLGDIHIVFDRNGSSNARYVQERFLSRQSMPANFFAADSTAGVIDYVTRHPEAIGIISASWISDPEDKTCQAYNAAVNVIGVTVDTLSRRPDIPREPYQAYIYDQSYPFCREVYAIRTGLTGSVGTGLISHISGEKGQLIIHKMGMVTATPPTRVVRIK